MTLWIAWSVLVTALVAAAALAAERICAAYRVARRGVWIAAIVASAIGSVLMGVRTKEAKLPRVTALRSTTSPNRLASAASVADVGGTSPRIRLERNLILRSLVAHADRWAAPVWVLMSAACFLSIGVSIAGLHRRRLSWVETTTEAGPILVARQDGPAVVGVITPHIVMPAWALERDNETRRLMLRHEIEHLRAGDSRVLFGSALLLALLPWNAGLWFMSRRLRLAIEIDCDARVIRSVGEARTYGLMLLSVGDRYATPQPTSALLFEGGAQLESRINAMTTPLPKRPMISAAICASVAGLVLATAAWTPRPTPFRTPPATIAGPQPVGVNPPPRYPNDMRAAGEEGVVVVSFVTDDHGVADTASMVVVQATNEAFASSVRSVLPRWHYSGAGAVQFVCRFKITPDQPRVANYASPGFVGGIDTLPQVVVTGVPVH